MDPDQMKRMHALAGYRVRAYLCATTFANNNLTHDRAIAANLGSYAAVRSGNHCIPAEQGLRL